MNLQILWWIIPLPATSGFSGHNNSRYIELGTIRNVKLGLPLFIHVLCVYWTFSTQLSFVCNMAGLLICLKSLVLKICWQPSRYKLILAKETHRRIVGLWPINNQPKSRKDEFKIVTIIQIKIPICSIHCCLPKLLLYSIKCLLLSWNIFRNLQPMDTRIWSILSLFIQIFSTELSFV